MFVCIYSTLQFGLKMCQILYKIAEFCTHGHRAIALSPQGRFGGCAAPLFISLGPFHYLSDVRFLSVAFFPFSTWYLCHRWALLPTPFRRSAWRDIRVRSALALIPLVTGSLLSSQRTGLIECVTPPFISTRPFHHLSDVGFLSVTFSFSQSCDALVIGGASYGALHTPFRRSVWLGIRVRFGLTLIQLVTGPLLSP